MGDEALGQMAERAREHHEHGEISGRRAYRNGEPHLHWGESDFAAYYDE